MQEAVRLDKHCRGSECFPLSMVQPGLGATRNRSWESWEVLAVTARSQHHCLLVEGTAGQKLCWSRGVESKMIRTFMSFWSKAEVESF